MKRRSIVILVILLLMLLRETGVVGLNLYKWKPEWTYTYESPFPRIEALHIRFDEDDGKPFLPKPSNSDETYDVVVRYRFDESLSWTRWIPLWKSGNNAVQLVYCVWLGSQLAGSGHVTLTGCQTVLGFCSAKEYRDQLRLSVIEEMHRDVDKKVHLFSRPEKPADAKTS